MRIVKLAFCAVIIVGLAGCAGVKVNQDYEPGTDFSAYQAFDWKSTAQPPTGDIRVDNPLLDNRIRKAVDSTLETKGFNKTGRAGADFLVNYNLSIQSRIDSSPVSVGTGFGIGGGGSFGGIGIGTDTIESYETGLLVIDFYDAGTGQIIWRGSGSRRLGRQSDPASNTEEIKALVDKILAQFPPVAKS
ncbi:MAG: DUF4136 domain-containing protein [Desulfobacterales bacterium]